MSTSTAPQFREITEKFTILGAESKPMMTARFELFLRAEIVKFAKAVKNSVATAE